MTLRPPCAVDRLQALSAFVRRCADAPVRLTARWCSWSWPGVKLSTTLPSKVVLLFYVLCLPLLRRRCCLLVPTQTWCLGTAAPGLTRRSAWRRGMATWRWCRCCWIMARTSTSRRRAPTRRCTTLCARLARWWRYALNTGCWHAASAIRCYGLGLAACDGNTAGQWRRHKGSGSRP